MPKKLLKKYMPDHHKIRKHPHLNKVFGTLLHDGNLWHLNRRSASGAFAVGLFVAFVPLPLQMIIAAAVAIAIRVNLPLSVALVWVTNPITIPPMFYGAYVVGAALMGFEGSKAEMEWSIDWFTNEGAAYLEPFLLGCFVLGTVSAAVGYATIRGLWRLHLVQRIRERRDARHARERQKAEQARRQEEK